MSKLNTETAEFVRKWTHKVVKKQRGNNGKWFAYRAAKTGTEDECREYAASFAAEQKGIGGTRIVLLTRGGALVAEHRC